MSTIVLIFVLIQEEIIAEGLYCEVVEKEMAIALLSIGARIKH